MKKWFKRWLKQLRCEHSWYTVRNIHGDEILHMNARSIRQCRLCGKVMYHSQLDKSPEVLYRSRKHYQGKS